MMPSLLVVVFLLQFVIHLINTVGASAINNLVYFPTIYLFPGINIQAAMDSLQQASDFHLYICPTAIEASYRDSRAKARNECYKFTRSIREMGQATAAT